MADDKIIVEFSPREAEVLCGAIANNVPVDKSHEIILSGLYARIRRKLEEFLQR